MIRTCVALMLAAAVAPAVCSDPLPPTANGGDAPPLSGLWFGSWGGGPQPGGVVFQPVIAEMLVRQDHIEVVGFPNGVSLVGTFRIDNDKKMLHLLGAKAGATEKPQEIDYTFQLKGETLTLTDSENRAVTLDRQPMSQKPPANLAIELVAAVEMNEAGHLVITEYTKLRAGSIAATYYQPATRTLKTKEATVMLVDESGCKKIPAADARKHIKRSTTVAIAYRPASPPHANQLHALWTEIGSAAGDDEAAMQTLARALRPGTLVFVLSAPENVPVP